MTRKPRTRRMCTASRPDSRGALTLSSDRRGSARPPLWPRSGPSTPRGLRLRRAREPVSSSWPVVPGRRTGSFWQLECLVESDTGSSKAITSAATPCTKRADGSARKGPCGPPVSCGGNAGLVAKMLATIRCAVICSEGSAGRPAATRRCCRTLWRLPPTGVPREGGETVFTVRLPRTPPPVE
jgi:hypothetical protein